MVTAMQMGLLPLMLFVLPACVHSVTGERYYITPSTCPQDADDCLTLGDIQLNHADSNATLILLPGNHTLNSELQVENLNTFIMYSNSTNVITWIVCTEYGSFTFNDIESIEIRDLAFMGCGETVVIQVRNFVVHGSIFRGYEDSGTALHLIWTEACITNSLFAFNTGTFEQDVDNIFSLVNRNYYEVGGAITSFRSKLDILGCNFQGNSAEAGGALYFEESIVFINDSIFDSNYAAPFDSDQALITGGVMVAYSNCEVSIINSLFSSNSGLAKFQGGLVVINSEIKIGECFFENSTGSMLYILESNLSNYNCVYEDGNSDNGAVLYADNSYVLFAGCEFVWNQASFEGGVVYAKGASIGIQDSRFMYNRAMFGGVVSVDNSTLHMKNATFGFNTATAWSCMYVYYSDIIMQETTFNKNKGGVLLFSESTLYLDSVKLVNNSADTNRGLLYCSNSVMQSSHAIIISGNIASDLRVLFLEKCIGNFSGETTFSDNIGSFLMINSLVSFHGETTFNDCSQSTNIRSKNRYVERGGAVTIIESTTYFLGSMSFLRNHAATAGGAIHATGSTIHMSGDVTIADNSAGVSGGGVYLFQSKFNCVYNCTFLENRAVRSGGAIHAIASTVYANDVQRGIWPQHLWERLQFDTELSILNSSPLTTVLFLNNEAQMGGALAFASNSKLYGNDHAVEFQLNIAAYGGAIYVDDYTSSSTCASQPSIEHSAATECFIQSLNYDGNKRINTGVIHYKFIDNYATISGFSLYGGLLDRCTESLPVDVVPTFIIDSSVTPVYSSRSVRSTETVDIDVETISSDPVRVCFCRDDVPDCEYQWTTEVVKKGHPFIVTLVAVDQVFHTVDATIRSFLSSPEGGLGEGQQSQVSYNVCTNLTYNVYSPLVLEELTLYAEGPCNNTGVSKRHVGIHFSACTCPIGFQPVETGNTKCDCTCDLQLRPYIVSCNYTTQVLFREDTVWISYQANVNNSGYIIYRYCPYNYCHPPSPAVSINLNVEDGSDAQCAFGHSGLLCGACKTGFSISLGSSRCIQCSKGWPGLLIVMLLLAILAGIVLVAVLLTLNLTVATGTLNGIIFYVNIITANFNVFIPTTSSNVVTVLLAWLNLDLGIDVCFYDGMDTYIKQWLQLAFPTYVILLVAVVIFVSERSSLFAKLIGKGNPVATLATLILLSYTKFLRAVIDIFSFAILKYPDGSSKFVWLPDASIAYLSGKHIPLFLTAVTIVALGVVYTLLLFSWQWLLKLPKKSIFHWIWNTRFNSFMDAYLAPHTTEHRYWTGLLLVARVVLYLISALNLSNNPRVIFLAISMAVSCLFILKAALLVKVYQKSPLELLEFGFHFNLLLLSLTSFYLLGDERKQTFVAYASLSIAFLLFGGIIYYHIVCTTRNSKWFMTLKNKVLPRRPPGDANTNLLDEESNVHASTTTPTSTVVEISPRHSASSIEYTRLNDDKHESEYYEMQTVCEANFVSENGHKITSKTDNVTKIIAKTC